MSTTAAKGFRACGVTAGLKASGWPDLALVVNTGPSFAAAGVFTSNRVFAAPVAWSRQAVGNGVLKAVVLNSGCANACTGEPGLADAQATATRVGDAVGVPATDVAVCSTGLIGERLPMGVLLPGVDAAVGALSCDGGMAAASAIITTDTHAKTTLARGAGYTIGGMAKGAGMLAPGLATMLVVLTTDAEVAAPGLQQALSQACSQTFNRLDSDGCMSTNDTVLLLASGASGATPELAAFTDVLTEVCHNLAMQLLGDAEGSAHDVAIIVQGAADVDDALTVGRAIAGNNLFKCAIFGSDPNWGRVLAAIGTTDAAFVPEQLDVSFNGVQVCTGGAIGADRSLVDLSPRECEVLVNLHAGNAQATIWTNDLTYDYVKENAEYSS